jgi:hypothetical protein
MRHCTPTLQLMWFNAECITAAAARLSAVAAGQQMAAPDAVTSDVVLPTLVPAEAAKQADSDERWVGGGQARWPSWHCWAGTRGTCWPVPVTI